MAGLVVLRKPQRQLSVHRRTTEGLTALRVVEAKKAARTAQRSLKRALVASNDDSDDEEEFEAWVARARRAGFALSWMQHAFRYPHPKVAPVLLDIDGLDPAQWYVCRSCEFPA